MGGTASFAAWWGEALWRLSVQVALLVVLALAAEVLLRRASPALRYGLWCVVLARLCIPLPLSLPVGLEARVREPLQAVWSRAVAPSPANEAAVSQTGPHMDAAAGQPRSTAEKAAWVWCVSAGLLGAVAAFRTLRCCRGLRRHPLVIRSEVLALLEELRGRLSVPCPVSLHYAEQKDLAGPAVAGVLSPRIVLPRRVAEQWPPEALRPVLVHELTHVRRLDLAVNLVQTAVQVFYFFHPFVWVANARLRQLRELLCDDVAIAGLDADRKSYGQSLLRVVEEASMRPMPGLSGAGFVELRSSVARRLVRVMQPGYVPYRKVGWAACAVVAVLAAACVACSSGTSKEETPVPEPAVQEVAIPEPEVVDGQKMGYRAEDIRSTSADTFFSRIMAPEPGYHHFAALRALGDKARISDKTTHDEIIRRASVLLRGDAPPGYPRWQICYVLSATRDPQVIPELKQALMNDSDTTMRGVAACALGEFDAAAVDPILREARGRETNPEVLGWIDTALNGAYRKP